MSDHKCGPAFAKAFFDKVAAAKKTAHPKAKYMLSCTDHETDLLGVDFNSQAGISELKDGVLTTTFADREKIAAHGATTAYKWLGSTPIAYIRDSDVSRIEVGGPTTDPDFFAAITEIEVAYPEDAKKYALTAWNVMKGCLGLAGAMVARGSIRDGKTIFQRADGVGPLDVCCTWDCETGNCSGTWDNPP